LCAIALVLGERTSSRASQIDQELVVDPVSASRHVQSEQTLAQTFTIGVTGQLHQIDLQVGRQAFPAILNVRIRETLPNGFPDQSASAIIAALQLPPQTFPAETFPTALVSIALGDQSLAVRSGDVLAIELSANSASNGPYGWALQDTEFAPPRPNYTGGSAYFINSVTAGNYEIDPNVDHGFRTHVDPIPEPTAAGLLALGVLLSMPRRQRMLR
jgi:hypothetical protein